MNKIKEMFSGTNKKLMMYLIIAVGFIVALFIFMGIVKLISGSRLSYDNVEIKLKNAAVEYYKDHSELLPNVEGNTVSVDATTLHESKKIKSLDKIVKKGSSCTGEVKVQKNGDFYLYTPYLDCGEEYKTTNLTDKILSDNHVVTEKDGLYAFGDDFLFRGEKVNNYVSFSGKTWRILRINADKTIRLIEDDVEYTGVWDDRYNITRQGYTGINDFFKSRLKDGLENVYNKMGLFNDTAKSQIVSKGLCVGKRSISETDNSGSVECSTVTDPLPVGLMQVNEFMIASLDPNCSFATDAQCSNYNYLANYTKSTWTLNADLDSTYKSFKFTGDGFTSSINSNESGFRLVINLSGNLMYIKGSGTQTDPYIVK